MSEFLTAVGRRLHVHPMVGAAAAATLIVLTFGPPRPVVTAMLAALVVIIVCGVRINPRPDTDRPDSTEGPT